MISVGGVFVVVAGSSGNVPRAEALKNDDADAVKVDASAFDPLQGLRDAVMGWFGDADPASRSAAKEALEERDDDDDDHASKQETTKEKEEGLSNQIGGTVPPGKKVVVELDPELMEELPVMSLEEVRACNGLNPEEERLLVTHDGVVYDVTQFAEDHPGGKTLLMTAAGLDLKHFFDNYTVHGETNKAARWLAPLAVGKLTEADEAASVALTTPHQQVERRAALLRKARVRISFVALSLPFWMTVRSFVRAVGCLVPSLGRLLADVLPVTVPGLSRGAEPLDARRTEMAVAVVGGGIAGCGAAWALAEDGFRVTLYEAREKIGGNARTFEWDFSPYRNRAGNEPEMDRDRVESCVSVTAWPSLFYKNYTCLLERLGVETVHQPLSWFLNSKVPGYEGTLWAADPEVHEGSLRKVFEKDFRIYDSVERFSRSVVHLFTLRWAPWRRDDEPSMYDSHQGLGLLNPLNVIPLYSLFKLAGGSDAWWNVVFTPHYTASFLVDELRPFPAVFGPLIEAQIPLNPVEGTNTWRGSSKVRGDRDAHITTCVTWKDAGAGIRGVFDKLVRKVDLRESTRVLRVERLPNGRWRVHDEHDGSVDVDRVVFACPSNAVGNVLGADRRSALEDAVLSAPVYADDHHPDSGHMHAVMHSDGSVVDASVRDDVLRRASNYVEVTRRGDGSLNIENQYNFGVQTPGPGVYDLPLHKKPVMLISHALGEGKTIDPTLVRGAGNHARAHPLYSGWNIMAQLSLRLVQGRDGVYYCGNWTTPGNCHDMSLLSGLVCAHAVGARYPFEENREARKDFDRLRDLMGV